MTTLNIDNKEYDLDKLSEEAKQQLKNVQFADQEIQRLQVQLALAQTARNTYFRALNEALGSQADENLWDTIKFN
ncbi:DUF6447 family protein [Flavobacterium sp.]|jgi:hypothetical protein|uniref:DUF6447 family protein n=1 Tax=Flavobacterium sp. TaxID=239 RepID=UPI0037BEEDB6